MHSTFAWGFWWLNALVCTYCVLYWAPKRFPDGTHALVMPSGQMWIWQLVFSILVLVLDASPWHLLWLAIVSILFSIISFRIIHYVRMSQRIKGFEATSPDYFKADTTATNKPGGSAAQISELDALHRELRMRGKTDVACKAGALLDSDAKRDILYDSLGEHPELAAKLHHYWPYLLRSNVRPTSPSVSLMFSNMAVKLAEEGEPFVGLKSIECSLLFAEGGPQHWVAQAEVLCGLKDRSAARYASAVIEYRDARDAATKAGLKFPYYEGHKVLRGEYKRMMEIVQICHEHGEWVDSHTFVEQLGIYNS